MARRHRVHSPVVSDPRDSGFEELLRAAAEIGVGATILALRQVNISRRRFVQEVPAAEPIVNAFLDQLEAFTPPVSQAIGAIVTSVGEIVPAPHGERLRDSGAIVASIGPELIRLSGLTRHD